MSKVIDEFMSRYNKEYDFYFNLAKQVEGELEKHLRDSGVRCIVSSRAKSPDRLRVKITGRNVEKCYQDVDAVFEDIVDLSGVRVAIYFPDNMAEVDKVIRDLFTVEKEKKFPEDKGQTPSPGEYEKVFSGYKARHYRVRMKGETRYSQLHPVEIQVASVLMHAWSEVEHDLVYKPFQGNLSREEHMILDEINGLVLAGNLALERLQQAGRSRTEAQNYEFKNHYDLTSYFINQNSSIMTEGLNFRSLFRILKEINRTKRSDLIKLSDFMKKNKDHLESIYNIVDVIGVALNKYSQALYSIVSVFRDDVVQFLSVYSNDNVSSIDIPEGTCNRIALAMRDYFRYNQDYKKTYSLCLAYKKYKLSVLPEGDNALITALKSVNLKLEGNSNSLIKALNEYNQLMTQWNPDNFTIEKYNRLFSLNTTIKEMVKPIRSPRPRRSAMNQSGQ